MSAYRRFGLDFNKYLEQGEKIDSDYKHLYYFGLGYLINGRGLVWKKGFEKYEIFEKTIGKIDLAYQSYYYEGLGYGVGQNVIYNQYEEPISSINRIPENKRYYAYLGMAKLLEEKALPETNIYEIINAIDKKYGKFFYHLIGKDILKRNRELKKVIAFTESLEDEEKEGVYRELGATLFKRLDCDILKFNKIIESFPKNSRIFLYEDAGEIIGFLNRNNVKNLQGLLKPLSESDKESLYRGIGRFAAERYGFNFEKYFDFIKEINPQYRTYCYKGVGTQIAFRFGGVPEVANFIIDKSSPNIRPIIQKGFAEKS